MNLYKTPPLLKAGSNIAITAPARKIDASYVSKASEILQGWGLSVSVAPNIFAGTHSYLSGNDKQRLSDLQELLNDSTIDAIFCARGGYGSSRIVDQLDFTQFKNKPKWLIGFSDITSIHLKMLSEGFASIHGTMPVLFPREDSVLSLESLRNLLFEGAASLDASPSTFNKLGICEAPVIGGNLSLIVDSLGTATEAVTHDTILVIEEIDEYFYKLDRMLNQLKRAGKLKKLKGLVIGHMTDIKNGELTFAANVQEVVLNIVKDYSYPVAFQFPTGHENPNLAWLEGGVARLSVSDTGSSLRFSPLTKSS